MRAFQIHIGLLPGLFAMGTFGFQSLNGRERGRL